MIAEARAALEEAQRQVESAKLEKERLEKQVEEQRKAAGGGGGGGGGGGSESHKVSGKHATPAYADKAFWDSRYAASSSERGITELQNGMLTARILCYHT